jgi:hypothetical protein
MVRRSGATDHAVSVDYSTVNGTASSGSQYTGTSGTLQWIENDPTAKTITVPIADVSPFSGTKTFQVRLTDPTRPGQVTSPGTAIVTISGNAAESAGALQLSSNSYPVAQATGSITITVDRVGGSTGAVSVSYATANRTAVAGSDYTETTGTLQWDDGDATAKTFSVPIGDGTGFSGAKTFQVTLSDPLSGASLGTPSGATVTINGQGITDAGSLSFSRSSYSVSQSAGRVTISVERAGSSSGAASVVYSTSNETALSGTDFTADSGTLQWASGDSAAKSFTVPISGATPFSGNKTFKVTLSSPSTAASIASPGQATVTIAGSAAAPVGSLALSASTYAVSQSSGTLTVTLNRTGGSSGTASVAYATRNGSAVAGSEYTAENGTLNWANGDSSAKSFTIPISNATPFSGNKSFAVTLSAASGATLASPSSATVTIAGSAVLPTGSLQLSAATYTVSQNAGEVAVVVDRTGGSSGAASVAYATSDGSAVAGNDYSPESGMLVWADGDSSPKTFTISISNATPFSGNESFTVTLSAVSGATLGSPSAASVTITGDAVAATGNLQLSAATYAVSQSAGEVTVVVDRTGGSAGSVSVAYATSDGTAVAGTDYTATSGTLDWADGDTSSASFQIPINTTPFTGSKSFAVTLSSPTGGATLSSPSSATLTITGSGSGTGSDPPSAPGTVGATAKSITTPLTIASIATWYIDWSAATPGTNPIAKYNIYSNGTLIGTSTTTNYTDTTLALGQYNTSSNPVPAYTVAAVDTQGNIGPRSATAVFYVYHDGVGTYTGAPGYTSALWQWDLSYGGGGPVNGRDTTHPESGQSYDLVVPSGAGWQPASSFNSGFPNNDTDYGPYGFNMRQGGGGPYTWMTLDVWTATPSDQFLLYFEYLGSWSGNSADQPANANVPSLLTVSGASARAGTWSTVKVPLAFVGQLGVPGVYKFAIKDNSGPNTFYVDRVGFVQGAFSWIYDGGQPTSWNKGGTAMANGGWSQDPATLLNGWADASSGATANYSLDPATNAHLQNTLTFNGGSPNGTTGLQTPGYGNLAPTDVIQLSVNSAGGEWKVTNPGGFNVSPYTYLTFALLPTSATYSYQVQFYSTSGAAIGNPVSIGPGSPYTPNDFGPNGGSWTIYGVPLAAFGAIGSTVGGLSIKDTSGLSSNTLYISAPGFFR